MRATISTTRARMAVRRVDDEDVGAGSRSAPARARRASGPTPTAAPTRKPALRVLRRLRELDALLDVLDGDQAREPPVGVDDRQLLDAVAVQQLLGLARASCRPVR